MADTYPYKPFRKIKTGPSSEEVHYSILYETLPQEFEKIAEEKLNETEDSRRRGLQHLKDFVSKQNLPFIREEYLLAILRQNKYKLKKSEAKVKDFSILYEELIKMLSTFDIEKTEAILDDAPIGALPYRDKHGRLIVYTRPNGLNLEAYTVLDAGVVFFAQMMLLLLYPLTSVGGIVYFADCSSPSIYILYSCIQLFRKYLPIITKGPWRGGRMEVINENPVVRCSIKVVRPFISKKICERIVPHGSSFDDLHEDYHPDMLPDAFGGNLGPLNNDAHKQKLLEFIRNVKKENSCNILEST